MGLDLWQATIDEARDRLMQGAANGIDDVVQQLVDEGVCSAYRASELKIALEMP
jgi:hypothetical protein